MRAIVFVCLLGIYAVNGRRYGSPLGTCPELRCRPLPPTVQQNCRHRPIRRSNTGVWCYGCEINRCCPKPCPPRPPNTPPTCIREEFINGPNCPFCELVIPECQNNNVPLCSNCNPNDFPRNFPARCRIRGEVGEFLGERCRSCDRVNQACYPDSEKRRLDLRPCPHISCLATIPTPPENCITLGPVIAFSGQLCLGCSGIKKSCRQLRG